MTPEETISKYIAIRDKKAELAAKHSEELRPFNDAMETIERWLLQKLNEQGLDSFKCSSGTAYKTVHTSVTMADADIFKRYVVRQAVDSLLEYMQSTESSDEEALTTVILSSPAMALFEIRSAKKEVQERMDQGESVPGLNISKTATVGVRRS